MGVVLLHSILAYMTSACLLQVPEDQDHHTGAVLGGTLCVTREITAALLVAWKLRVIWYSGNLTELIHVIYLTYRLHVM